LEDNDLDFVEIVDRAAWRLAAAYYCWDSEGWDTDCEERRVKSP